MQSIYQKDNINYGSLIDAAIKNRIDTINRNNEYFDEIIKEAGKQGISVLGRWADEKWGGSPTEAEIEREKLIKENEDIYNIYSDYMSDSNATGTDYWTNQMQGYKPAGRSIYSDEQTNAYDKIFGGTNIDSNQLINEIQNDSTYFYRRDPIHMNPLNRSTGEYRRDPDYNIYEDPDYNIYEEEVL